MTESAGNTEKPRVNRYVFGPVPSRRLGSSLGLDLVPYKTCTLDCQYCEVGLTTNKTIRRFNNHMAGDLLAELKRFLDEQSPKLDYITLAGSGEPTLNAELGRIITGVREISPAPMAILTNGTLLFDREVRRELLALDLAAPSLDTARAATFQRLNRPHPDLDLDKIIDGLVAFRQEFSGALHLEILLVKGINDSDEELASLKEAIARIQPDRIQLNTVLRPPALKSAQPLTAQEMRKAAEFFGPLAEANFCFQPAETREENPEAGPMILEMIGRRPCTVEDMASSLLLPLNQVNRVLMDLEAQAMIIQEKHAGKIFFRRR